MKRGDFVEYTGPRIKVTVPGLYSVTIESGAMGHVLEPDALAKGVGGTEQTIVQLHPLCWSFLTTQLKPGPR